VNLWRLANLAITMSQSCRRRAAAKMAGPSLSPAEVGFAEKPTKKTFWLKKA
jgi:hypothetical protein